MLRDHTQTQADNLALDISAPCYVFELDHGSGVELFSVSGVVELDGQLYSNNEAELTGGVIGSSASIELLATPARIMQVYTKAWRGGECRVYNIPAVPGASRVFTMAEAIKVIDGEIIQSSWGGAGKISVQVTQNDGGDNLTPRDRLDRFGQHMPAPGTVIRVGADEVILVVRR